MEEEKKKRSAADIMRKVRNVRYYLMLSLHDEGCTVQRFSFDPATAKISDTHAFTLRNVHEKNLAENKILKLILRVIYFPFPYRVILQVPHQFSQSRYDGAAMKREKAVQQVSVQELNSFFTHTVWKLVEKNKKLFMARHKYDDVNTLLAHNVLVAASVGKRDVLHEPEDTIVSQAGTELKAGIVQTHLYRPIFAQLAKILPKRAHIQSVLENGFPVAYALHQTGKAAHEAILCMVERNRTHLFRISADEVFHAGSFNFGTHSAYEACNNLLGVGMEAYRSMLDRCMKGELSPHAKKYLEKIIGDELTRLQKGIESFKKELKVKTAYADAGMLNHFIGGMKKFPARILEESDFRSEQWIKTEGGWNMYANAAVQYSIPLAKKTYARSLMQKLFRWLTPSIIE
jgi:hypothetical protein